MTDNITAQDRRLALRWCGMLGDSTHHEEAAATRRIILATVEAPAPSLAEELRSWAEDASYDEDRDNLLHAAARAEQMEHGIAEARAEVERLKRDLAEAYKTRDARDDEVDSLRAEVERLTAERDRLEAAQYLSDGSAWGGPVREPTVQKGAESNAETPDPADVKPGEAWVVEANGKRGVGARCDPEDNFSWIVADLTTRPEDSWFRDMDITLMSRLVPATRAITNPDELDALPVGTILRDEDGAAWHRITDQWTSTVESITFTSRAVLRRGPVTVLWEA